MLVNATKYFVPIVRTDSSFVPHEASKAQCAPHKSNVSMNMDTQSLRGIMQSVAVGT